MIKHTPFIYSLLILRDIILDDVPPSIPSRTGLPLLISKASSSAGVKLAGGGPPPVPATSVFFLVAAIKKVHKKTLNSCSFKLALITYIHTIRFTYHSELYFYILFSPAARFFFLHLSCCCVKAVTVIHTQTLQCIMTHIQC